MAEIQIAYEIERRDYAEANAAVHTAARKWYLDLWAIVGSAVLLLCLPLSYREPGKDWDYPYLVLPFVAYLLYWAALWISPFLNGYIAYRHSSLSGQKYVAHFSPAEVRVSGEDRTWINQWRSFKLFRESNALFIFYDGNTMFIFAKRYFTASQMEDLRQLMKSEQADREHQ
jgi:hypothetical protein